MVIVLGGSALVLVLVLGVGLRPYPRPWVSVLVLGMPVLVNITCQEHQPMAHQIVSELTISSQFTSGKNSTLDR